VSIAAARHAGVGFLTMVLASCLAPVTAGALGFGALRLDSHLNEPLQATVSLLLGKSEAADQVRMTLADKSEYKRMGLRWHAYLAQLRVKKLKREANGASVRLYSETPMHAPIVSILLKAAVKGGRGTYFRLYRFFLLDPTETAPLSNQRPDMIRLRTDKGKLALLPASAVTTGAWARATRYGPVRSGESLGRIAQRLRKDKRFSNSQVMLALYDENKDAFVNGNINQLEQGAWLKVPDGAVVRRDAGEAGLQRLRAQLQRSADSHAKKRVSGDKRPVAETKPIQGLQYSANISLRGARGAQAVEPDSTSTTIKVKRLAPIYAELMAGKLQMTNLGASVSGLNKSVAAIQQDMQILKHDVAMIKNRPQMPPPAEPSMNGSVALYFYILLAGMTGILVGVFIRRGGSGSKHESDPISPMVEGETPGEVLTAVRVENGMVADEVVQLINKVEDRLGRCDYEEASRLLDEVASRAPDSLRVAALRAQLYHETGHAEQRDVLINQISEFADRDAWQRFCHYLPSHVWDACFGAGAEVENVVDPSKG